MLNVTFIDGFSPPSGHTFDILDFGTISGGFRQFNLPGVNSRLTWDTSGLYTTGELVLVYDPIPGDANRNGVVDNADAAILGNNWQSGSGLTWDQGDFNGDGFVDDRDATILAANWQASTGGDSASVPEPAAAVLLMCLAISAAAMLRRR